MKNGIVETLGDIARLAHVSTSTVSRALNNSPLINQATRERIQEIAREYHYRVNVPARNLRLGKSRTIAFVVSDSFSNYYFGEDLFGTEILIGVGHGLRSLGYDLLIAYANLSDPTWATHYLDSGRADGFILMTSNFRRSTIRALIDLQVPFIGWGTHIPDLDYCSVAGDNVTGGMLATTHLIQQGRRKIAFLGGPEESMTIQHRLQGYEKALQAGGYELDSTLVTFTDYTYEAGMHTMQSLINSHPDLDAVCVSSDLMAIGAINVIQCDGKRVPEDIAVIGYDDLPIAYYNNLPLTTIRQNIPLAGKMLAQNLVEYIQDGVISNVTTPVELVVRRSA